MSLIDNIIAKIKPGTSGSKNNVVALVEPIDVLRGDGQLEENLLVYLNTGEEYSQIDENFAVELGLYSAEQVVDRIPIRNPETGRDRLQDLIEVTFELADVERRSRWLVTDRSDCKQLIQLGKQDLRGLAVLVPEIQE